MSVVAAAAAATQHPRTGRHRDHRRPGRGVPAVARVRLDRAGRARAPSWRTPCGCRPRAIAKEIDREGITSAAGSARNAERFIGDARMVVLVPGEVVHWSDPVGGPRGAGDGPQRRRRGGPGAPRSVLRRLRLGDLVARHRRDRDRGRPDLGALERRLVAPAELGQRPGRQRRGRHPGAARRPRPGDRRRARPPRPVLQPNGRAARGRRRPPARVPRRRRPRASHSRHGDRGLRDRARRRHRVEPRGARRGGRVHPHRGSPPPRAGARAAGADLARPRAGRARRAGQPRGRRRATASPA